MSLKYVPLILAGLLVAYLAGLSFMTRHDRVKPVTQRSLDACPDKPNCVSSLAGDDIHRIEAFQVIGDSRALSWDRLIAAVERSGGSILVNDGRYCHAVFRSLLFRFKDDFEAVLAENQIDVRSASRAGTSDLGQNRKRVERLRQLYQNHPVDS